MSAQCISDTSAEAGSFVGSQSTTTLNTGHGNKKEEESMSYNVLVNTFLYCHVVNHHFSCPLFQEYLFLFTELPSSCEHAV